MSDSSDFITPKECAALVKLSPAALYMRSRRGNGPPAHRISPRLTRYRRSEVLAWLGAEARAGESEPDARRRVTVEATPAPVARALNAFVDEISASRTLDGEVAAAIWRVAGLKLALALGAAEGTVAP